MAADAEGQEFVIDAQIYPSKAPTYDVQVTIENTGEDWEGMVRLTLRDFYGSVDNCSYDTVLSLPQGSKKQFAVRIPKNSLTRTDGMVLIELFDKKNKMTASKNFNRLLQGGTDALTMGILSDKYPSLTYLDMGGNEVYYGNRTYPVKLMELNQDSLMSSLPALNFLVIDSYDTSVLTDEVVTGIEKWTDSGGMLLIGTGSFAQDTLSAFDYLDIQSVAVYPPGDSPQNDAVHVDTSQLHMAELENKTGTFYTYDTLARICPQGDGAVGVLPYALTELGGLDIKAYSNAGLDTKEHSEGGAEAFVESILSELSNSASGHNINQGQSYYNFYLGNNNYIFNSLFELFGNGSTRLSFGGLKIIVMVYVVFVGPVLYMILRFVKKRDYYWWTVPVSAFVGILLVYWAGRGFEVVNTRVYSVTIENLSDEGNFITYLHCYDADHSEWDLRLAEGYQYVGLVGDNYYGSIDSPYYFHTRQEGDRLSFGADPNTSFEDCFFQAGGIMHAGSGSIQGDIIKNAWNIGGTIANNTKQDFAYFAVIADGQMVLYKNLPAGAVCDLSSAEEVYSTDGGGDVVRDYMYEHIREICNSKDRTDIDILSALGMGISTVYPQAGSGRTIIIGVTDDWNKAVDDSCSEAAYGCLYAVQ
ncbi:MAG: hypothetical protein K2N73_04910 [Lachnospiraceae bacterium]|nr:hypothetical protein [Lachnospiraceae bacterium]